MIFRFALRKFFEGCRPALTRRGLAAKNFSVMKNLITSPLIAKIIHALTTNKIWPDQKISALKSSDLNHISITGGYSADRNTFTNHTIISLFDDGVIEKITAFPKLVLPVLERCLPKF